MITQIHLSYLSPLARQSEDSSSILCVDFTGYTHILSTRATGMSNSSNFTSFAVKNVDLLLYHHIAAAVIAPTERTAPVPTRHGITQLLLFSAILQLGLFQTAPPGVV